MKEEVFRKSRARDTAVSSLLLLRVSHALLAEMKDRCDIPKGRLVDRAIEDLAIKLLGDDQVESIKQKMKRDKY